MTYGCDRCCHSHFVYAYSCIHLFSLQGCLRQPLQIHPAQRRTTEVRFYIRHGQDAPIAVGWFVGNIIFQQSPCHIQGNRLRCNLRKPLSLFGGQSDGFYPKRTKPQRIGNHIIKAEDQVALRALREDRDLKLNDLFFAKHPPVFRCCRQACVWPFPPCRGWHLQNP